MAQWNKLLKPDNLDVDPNTDGAAREWKCWLKKFENFIANVSAAADGTPVNKLMLLQAHLSSNVFEYVEDCVTYETAIVQLKKLYIKSPNPIYTRHLLATRKQKPGESFPEFLQSLHKLSKDCQLKDVNAEEYRKELVRDAFINGLSSTYIRSRLFEQSQDDGTLDLDKAYSLALSLHTAQIDSASYQQPSQIAAMQGKINNDDDAGHTTFTFQDDTQEVAALPGQAFCSYCGRESHERVKCPAKRSTCRKCEKIGHWSNVCRSNKFKQNDSNSKSRYSRVSSVIYPSLCAIPGSLALASIVIKINGKSYDGLMDSCSTDSYINSNILNKVGLSICPCSSKISMARTDVKSKTTGFCVADLEVEGRLYNGIRLSIMDHLCSDVLLGLDFQRLHQQVVFEFNGELPELTINKDKNCALVSAVTNKTKLFPNLPPDCKPIVSPSRRFNKNDQNFIKETILKWKEEDIIEPSNSPWRAQVVVCKDENDIHRQRLCIDYSQTINIYTELDAFPLPRIDTLINDLAQYSFFSTYDLKTAYHQISIPECDRKYTAFEACSELLQFKRVPNGVTNGVPVFQRHMTDFVVEEDLHDTFPYLDGITVAGHTLDEHDANCKAFETAAEQRNFTLNDSKTIKCVTQLKILGYIVGKGRIAPDPERLQPLQNFPPPQNKKSLERVLGMLAYYAKWIPGFSDKIRPLADSKEFPLGEESLNAFKLLKDELVKVTLQAVDEDKPFVVECDASDVAVSATLNQGGRPVAFFSRTLSSSERNYPAVEKEATAIIESVRKWKHWLLRKHFILITDQRAVSFMFDNTRRSKIKNDKIQMWRLDLAEFSYTIKYRPGSRNIAPDSFTRAFCSAISSSSSILISIHNDLCHPGITKMLHYIKTKNLPYSTEEVRSIVNNCKICAKVKPRFFQPDESKLVKATAPMQRFSIDFKGPLPSVTTNKYFLTVIDEYSRMPFAFPCPNIDSGTVIKCLISLFSLVGYPDYIHSDRGSSFMSKNIKDFLFARDIATSRTTPYHPTGNGQCEKYNGIIWKNIQLSLMTQDLPTSQWEYVISDALHSIRSTLCTTTNCTPHERFFNFPRRSTVGKSIPTGLMVPGKALLRRFVRQSKVDPLVDEVDVLDINPTYANIRHADGRESTVNLRDLAPLPSVVEDTVSEISDQGKVYTNDDLVYQHVDNHDTSESFIREIEPDILTTPIDEHQYTPSDNLTVPIPTPDKTPQKTINKPVRSSTRSNKGIAPKKYGYD